MTGTQQRDKRQINQPTNKSKQTNKQTTTTTTNIPYSCTCDLADLAQITRLGLAGQLRPCSHLFLFVQVLHFATHVRTRDTRNLVIHNRTNQLWMLRPVIDGEYWTGPDTITVEPQQSKNYELTYRPLTMTQEGKKHTVSSQGYH